MSLKNSFMSLRNSLPPFERVTKATNRGFSQFGKCMPFLVRLTLLLLFIWYCFELYQTAVTTPARLFVQVTAGLVALTFVLVVIMTYVKYPWTDDTLPALPIPPLWPFLLMNLTVIILVAAMGKWNGQTGLLGFTQHWIYKIIALFGGGNL